MFSAFNPSKCTHTWSSGHTHTWSSGHTHTHTPGAVDTHTHTWRRGRPGSSRGLGALLKGLTSVVYNTCWSWDSNPQPRVTSPTLYPLGHDCPPPQMYGLYKLNKAYFRVMSLFVTFYVNIFFLIDSHYCNTVFFYCIRWKKSVANLHLKQRPCNKYIYDKYLQFK